MVRRPSKPHDQGAGHASGPGVFGSAGRSRPDLECHVDLHDAAVPRGTKCHLAGAQRRPDGLDLFKSVYSIFVSRVDVYTEKHLPDLSPEAQGIVGIYGAKRIWLDNQKFWSDKSCPLEQEIIFASTGTKKPEDPPDKYVRAFAGSDIETNPPATNQYVAEHSERFDRQVDVLPPDPVVSEIEAKVDFEHLEATLMAEGVKKFADPQKALLALIAEKRAARAA